QADRRVAALLHDVAGTSAAGLEPASLLLVLQAGDLRLQLADVVLRRLVVRRPLDLFLDRFDLLLEGRHGRSQLTQAFLKGFHDGGGGPPRRAIVRRTAVSSPSVASPR